MESSIAVGLHEFGNLLPEPRRIPRPTYMPADRFPSVAQLIGEPLLRPAHLLEPRNQLRGGGNLVWTVTGDFRKRAFYAARNPSKPEPLGKEVAPSHEIVRRREDPTPTFS